MGAPRSPASDGASGRGFGESARAWESGRNLCCESIVGLRGLRIVWGKKGTQNLYALLAKARDRHDDDVLMWIKRHTRQTE